MLSDIQFTCNTIINSVILGIDVRPNRDSFPSVQIWRPTGEDEYAFVPGSERFIFIQQRMSVELRYMIIH